MKRSLPYLLLIAAVVVLDQLTKALVVRQIGLHDYIPLVDGMVSLSHVRNHGAAFGLLSDWNLPYQSLLLSVLSLAALGAIATYFVRLPAAALCGSVSGELRMSITSSATPIVMAESAVLKSGHWYSRQ